MGSVSEEPDRFFDTREDITSASESSRSDSDSDYRDVDFSPGSLEYRDWIEGPSSIRERRSKFLRWMGLTQEERVAEEEEEKDPRESDDRVTESSGAVLGSSGSEKTTAAEEEEESLSWRIRNLDDGTEFLVDDRDSTRLRRVGSGQSLSFEEFERSLGMSPLVQRLMQKGRDGDGDDGGDTDVARKRAKKRWLKRISATTCIVDKKRLSTPGGADFRAQPKSVKVRANKKRSKELSALYLLQDMRAHEGSILSLEFSPDGEHLASGGDDGVVRVWRVVERERLEEFDVCESDPNSYAYFKMTSDSSEVVPSGERKEKLKASGGKVTIVLPRTVFHISEEPVHEFRGHRAEVLDLSWSKNKRLLSSSADKTVRLWEVGCEHCLKVFSHNSYVTSIQFNPVDDNYFISGSIDGKVRIWEVQACQVADWTDITEIVTAVCYRPDGKGGVVGSMNGDCHFYDLSDNRLQLYAEISLQGKKKSPLKRITGFQYSPTDSNKLMITSADSHVRMLHGSKVICKYRGLRNTGSQISARFTSDGAHIVSASEDSNVYIWDYRNENENNNNNKDGSAQPKSHWSCERFFSHNCSVAVPWRSAASDAPKQPRVLSAANHGSATWPEENLPSAAAERCRGSQHKFLRLFCQSSGNSFPRASWGSVIVTAGWDGRIRSFQNYGLPV